MKQRYFLELDKRELELVRNMCKTYYQVAKENWSLGLMIKSKGLEYKLDSILKVK